MVYRTGLNDLFMRIILPTTVIVTSPLSICALVSIGVSSLFKFYALSFFVSIIKMMFVPLYLAL